MKLVLTLLFLVSTHAVLALDYVVIPISDDVFPSQLNNRGQVVGTQFRTSGYPRAVVWSNGIVTPFQDNGETYDVGMSISENGICAGVEYMENGSVRPILWKNGERIDLIADLLGNDQYSYFRIESVTDSGEVVGVGYPFFGSAQAKYWNSDHRVFPLTFGEGVALNDNGLLVGLSSEAEARYYRVINGEPVFQGAIPLSGDPEGWRSLRAVSLSDDGLLTGTGIYNDRDTSFTVSPTGHIELSYGFVLAKSRTGSSVSLRNGIGSGWFVNDDDIQNLLPEGWLPYLLMDINDNGAVLGYASYRSGSIVPVIFSPVPEPGSLLFLAAGVSLCIVMWRRRS